MKPLIVAFLLLVPVAACAGGDEDAPPSSERSKGREPPPVEEGFDPGRSIGRLQDERITESSGIVASATQPGRYWTHNDSGGDPIIFCLERDGRTCGTVTIEGADTFDWEDIARGPGPDRGTSYLYIGDIGDNTGSREAIVVYRVSEPAGSQETVTATAITLRYPDGPHDAETLMVHPATGDLYVVSKGEEPVAYVARAPLQPSMELAVAGRPSIPSLLPGPTGGEISPDGRHIVLAFYSAAVELARAPGTRARTIWGAEPMPIDLPPVTQREAICYSLDGRSVISTSEGNEAPIQEAVRGGRR